MILTVTKTWLTLLCFHIIRGEIQWTIDRKIVSYGHDLVLFCKVDDCCKDQAGWSVNYNTIYLDVRRINVTVNAKYDAAVNRTGFSLIIRRVTENDINKPYFCSHGFENSIPKLLGEADAFMSPDLPETTTAQTSEAKQDIIFLLVIVGIPVLVVIFLGAVVIYCLWNKCENSQRSGPGSREEQEKFQETYTLEDQDDDKVKTYNQQKNETQLSSEPSVKGENDKIAPLSSSQKIQKLTAECIEEVGEVNFKKIYKCFKARNAEKTAFYSDEYALDLTEDLEKSTRCKFDEFIYLETIEQENKTK